MRFDAAEATTNTSHTPSAEIARDLRIIKHRVHEAQKIALEGYGDLREFREEHARLIRESEERLRNLEDEYSENRAIGAAEKYWDSRRKHHGILFWVWAGLTAITGVGGCITLFAVYVGNYYESDALTGKNINYYHIGIAAFSAAMIALAVRVMTRISLSCLHLSNDAEERVVMTRTYLRLENDDHIERKKDLRLIIQNLFRPTNAGLVKDEVVPALLLELASRIASNSSSDNP